MQKYKRALKIYFIISIPLLVVGIYGLLSQHMHISGHAPDSLRCVSDFGFQQLPFAVVLTMASLCGFFILKIGFLKALLTVSAICMTIVLLLSVSMGLGILSGGCGGDHFISSPPVPPGFDI